MEIVFMMLPGVVSLIVCVVIWSMQNLTLSLRHLGWTMAISFLYSTFVALTNFRYVDANVLVWSYIGLGFLAPTLQYVILILSWSLSTQQQRYNRYIMFLLLVPAFTGVLVMAGYCLIGFDAAADYFAHGNMPPAGLSNYQKAEYDIFRFLTSDLYLSSCGLGMLITVAYQIYLLYKTDFTPKVVLRFLFKKGPIRPLHLFIILYFCVLATTILRMRVDRQYAFNHAHLYSFLFATQAFFFALIGFLAFKFKQPCVYLNRPHPQPLYDDLPIQVHNPFDKNADPNELEDEEAETYRTLNLRHELKVLMREEACFLQPGMSRYSVSRRLDLSREGLDRLILLLHHTTYKEYVMVQRVEYYRRYTHQYPEEPHESVAMACGFQSAMSMKREVNECRSFFQPIEAGVYD